MEERMKNPKTTSTYLASVLAMTLAIMSCSPAPQNSDQPTNAHANAANGPEKETSRLSKPCTKKDIDDEMKKIIKEVGIENQALKYDVMEDGGKWILLIEGGISDGKKNDPNGNSEFMEMLIKSVDQLVETNCVFNAIFVSQGTIEDVRAGRRLLRDVEGFEWSSCDWPNQPCPGGICANPCPGIASNVGGSPAPGNNANTANANANKDSNKGSNTKQP